MVARMLVVVALALGLTACRGGGGRDDPATAVAPPTHPASATATASTPPPASATASANAPLPAPPVLPNNSLPAGCDEAMILRVVHDFIAAFNRGDRGTLARLFPARGSDGDHPWVGDPDQLRWFTLTRANPSKGVDALNLYTRDTLLAYFDERHAQHEQMRVIDLVINPAGGGPLTAAINFFIARTADDLPESIFGGKGGVGCARGLIFLWSQGGPSGSPATPAYPHSSPPPRRGQGHRCREGRPWTPPSPPSRSRGAGAIATTRAGSRQPGRDGTHLPPGSGSASRITTG
jgi:hypothetical protein